VLLLGRSGAGKSTLLAALAGLLDPEHSGESEGTLLVDGRDPREARGRSGLLLQDPESGLVMATAGDDVAFGLENRAVPADEIWPRVDEALGLVGFPHGRDRPTAALSGGEKQRLALAGVLAHRPGLLLLDEPTANLDPAGAALVRAAIHRASGQTGTTTVLVEHRVDQVAELDHPLVDRVLVLQPGGGLQADGSPAAVFEAHGAALADAGVWVPGRPPRMPGTSPAAIGGPELLRADDATVTGRLSPVSLAVRGG
jgi:energy-coupling factor transport system ATP-binding protein